MSDLNDAHGVSHPADGPRMGHSRRAFLKRVGGGALLVGAGGVVEGVLSQELKPKTPPRVQFALVTAMRVNAVTTSIPSTAARPRTCRSGSGMD